MLDNHYALLGPRQLGPGGLPVGDKPAVFPQLAPLARRIHRERGADALQLTPERVTWKGEVRDTVRVVATHPVSGEARLIGHAWINGRDWRVLAAALEQHTPLGLTAGPHFDPLQAGRAA